MKKNATFEDARDIAIVLGEYLFSFLHPLCRFLLGSSTLFL